MALMIRPRGAKPTPRHVLASAERHKVVGTTPVSYLVLPAKLSMWLNDVDGDCVTAEEAFAKACSGILISDATVQTWATGHDALNGAYLNQVLDQMTTDGFRQDGNTYDDGPSVTVDWTNAAALQNAISLGPVKIGVAAGQLENVVGSSNGWFATGFSADGAEDHCVSLCGYGTVAQLAVWLGVSVPSNVIGTAPAYAIYTWKTVGIIDAPSMLAITAEAWLRQPTTKTVGTGSPSPDSVTVFGGSSPPPPNPPPPPNVRAIVDAAFAAQEQKYARNRTVVSALRTAQPYIDAALGASKATDIPQPILDAIQQAEDDAATAKDGDAAAAQAHLASAQADTAAQAADDAALADHQTAAVSAANAIAVLKAALGVN